MGRKASAARIALFSAVMLIALSTPLVARAATLTVGPGKMYAKPCAAIAAASDGDTIEIDASGSYDGDVCAIAKNRLTLRGVNGRPKIDAAGKNYGGKGIWVISGSDTTVENIEFSGAVVPDKNGAGIRQEGSNLTVRGCYFHDNEDGILTGGGTNTEVIVEYSEFAANGNGDGFSHNMYIGHEGRFTLRYSYSHTAKVGHLVKSRAAENYILYNRLSGEDGSASYELDLPNAGTSYVIGNLIQQGNATQNPTFVTYGVEGTTAENPGHALFVVNNTFVNDRTAGGTFIAVGGAITTPVVITNNIFFGAGTITAQTGAMQTTNFSQGDPKLVDRVGFDYRLAAGSPCIDAGSDPGIGAGFALLPVRHYVHSANAADRVAVGAIDIGAYEFGSGASDAGSDASMGVDGSSRADGSIAADASSTADATGDAAPTDTSTGDVASGDALTNDVTTTDATTPITGGPSDSSGCTCRVATVGAAAGIGWRASLPLAALLFAVRRRRAPRHLHPAGPACVPRPTLSVSRATRAQR